jgi:hypothetical protein
MSRRTVVPLVLAFAMLLIGSLQRVIAAEPGEFELAKVDRRIGREPRYVSKRPRYGLLVLGSKATTRVWAVFDKSKAAGSDYDVLYFDRNANGNLTEADERIVGKPEGKESLVFAVGSFKDPATGEVHTDISFQAWRNDKNDENNSFTVDIYVKWLGKHVVHCGFDERFVTDCQFTDRPASAPVYWLGGDAPLCVSRWMWNELAIGQTRDIRVLLGYRGIGRGSFSALSQDYLPVDLPILATLIYSDAQGKERRVLAKIQERC